MNASNILFALVFVVVGVGLVAFGWMEYQNQQSDLEEAVQIEGTVESTEIDEENTEGGGFKYEAIVIHIQLRGAGVHLRKPLSGSGREF